MKRLFFVIFALAAVLSMQAQLVTTSPTILQEHSQDVVLTYHADSDLGDKGLANLSPSTAIYAHIGVITDKSNGSWAYVVADWPSSSTDSKANTDKNRLTYVAENTYTLNIGDIHTYFGVPESEIVKKIAIVFRNAGGSKTGRAAGGGDIFIDVNPDGFAMLFNSDAANLNIVQPTTVNFTTETTIAADITINVNGTQIASETAVTKLAATHTFDTVGEYTVTANAVYEGKTYTEKIVLNYLQSSPQVDYPGGVPQMGCVKNEDGTVTFCLGAPDKHCVTLVGSWDNYQVLDKNIMNYQDYEGNRYFWLTVSGLANDVWYSYYFDIDNEYKVGDPYAHLVLDCYNDRTLRNSVWLDRPKYPSELSGIMLGCYRGDIDDYEFSDFTIPDHNNLVIYEMLFRDFTLPSGLSGLSSGWGTVKLAKEKIPYIKAMGFNAIELMPIMEFNGNNSWGYNTNFYMAPDKAYGSPTDYKDFIEECHNNGIAVILDIVFNQSDGLHPWYQMYPIDDNPFYNKNAPHDWSVLNDWRQDNPLVQQQWDDAIKYWMTAYNVDGFRFDLVKGLGDNDSYGSGTEAYNSSRVERMKRLHAVITSVKPNGIHINENLAGSQEEKEMGNDGQLQWANVNDACRNFAKGSGSMNFMRFYSKWDSSRPVGSTVSYAESHDEQRIAYDAETNGSSEVKDNVLTRYRRLGSMAAQMLLIPGPKMVWQFGEFGNNQNTKDSNWNNDTSPKLVDWDTWLADPNSTYLQATYSKIINLRMDNPELFSTDATFDGKKLASTTDSRIICLTSGNKEVIAFFNPNLAGSQIVTYTSTVITPEAATLIAASPEYTPSLSGEGNNLSINLPANCFAVFASNDVAGVEDLSTELPTRVYGGQGCIIIAGNYTDAAVYDFSGRRMCSLEVPAGLYVVVVDGIATKVLVK